MNRTAKDMPYKVQEIRLQIIKTGRKPRCVIFQKNTAFPAELEQSTLLLNDCFMQPHLVCITNSGTLTVLIGSAHNPIYSSNYSFAYLSTYPITNFVTFL